MLALAGVTELDLERDRATVDMHVPDSVGGAVQHQRAGALLVSRRGDG
jgi:hypothetical protein